MKKDLLFIKEVLNTLETSPEPYLAHSDILKKIQPLSELTGKELLKKYYYQISLLYDLNCLESVSGDPRRKGFDFLDDEIDYIDIDIRLTNNGHTMIIALNDTAIWNKLLSLGNKITNEVLIEAGKRITNSGLDSLFS